MCDERHHPEYADQYVKDALVRAVGLLVERDAYLLTNALYEAAITHRIAVYLEDAFATYDVDCEYDQNQGASKAIPVYGDARPDVIVHCRSHNQPWNVLAIEAKKRGQSIAGDLEKLRGLRYSRGEYGYQVVAMLRLGARSVLVDFGDAQPTLVPEGGERLPRVRVGWLDP